MRSVRVIEALSLRADTFSFILSSEKNATQFFREFTAKQTQNLYRPRIYLRNYTVSNRSHRPHCSYNLIFK